ncbi:hypothetical protein BDA99DRAFT_534542 [Phascolomyces articulosus]|uniref:Uncharacterized protein n=1 Tax=Phascolomyces articulosus TaxID=60185 RepID=A0AAD5K5E2_9FUNG|nr:hypothetical protein BDA99DRAFT_534542 [Phascolomyces articulosus]
MLSSFAFPEPQLKSIDINTNKKKNTKNLQHTQQHDEIESVHELTNLIGRLTAQLEKLETTKAEKKSNSNNEQEQQQHPQQQSNYNNNSNNINNNNNNSTTRKRIIINPLAADVTQSYDNLIQHNENLKQSMNMGQHHCRCCSCANANTSTGGGGTSLSSVVLPHDENSPIVEAASGIPWYSPLIHNNGSNASNENPLQVAYTHWCTLMRCLPLLDPAAQYYIRAVGQYAMRQLLHSMQNNGSTLTRPFNNNNNCSRTSSMMLTTPSSPPPPPSCMQRHSYYHGSSNTLLSNKTAGMGSSHSGSSHTGSSTLLAQHSLSKTSSTCLNDMIHHHHHHPHFHSPSTANHSSMAQETSGSTALCKADGWVPPPRSTMMDDTNNNNNPSYLYHSHNNYSQQQRHRTHPTSSQFQSLQNHYSGDEHNSMNHAASPPLPLSSASQPPVTATNVDTSPLPTTTNGLFTSPLMQHVTRPYHATKLRRWFKRHNKVAPLGNNND